MGGNGRGIEGVARPSGEAIEGIKIEGTEHGLQPRAVGTVPRPRSEVLGGAERVTEYLGDQPGVRLGFLGMGAGFRSSILTRGTLGASLPAARGAALAESAASGEPSGVYKVLSQLHAAGYRLGKSGPLANRFLRVFEEDSVRISRENSSQEKGVVKEVVYIINEGPRPLWLLQDGKPPLAVVKNSPEGPAQQPIELSEGAILVRAKHLEGIPSLDNAVYRVEKENGVLRLSKYERSTDAIPSSWSVENYLAWLLGYSPNRDLRGSYGRQLRTLREIAKDSKLKDSDVKQILDLVVEVWGREGRESLPDTLDRFLYEASPLFERAKAEGWSATELRTVLMEFLRVREELLSRDASERPSQWSFIPPLGPELEVLTQLAGFSWEQAVALILDLTRINPNLERREILPGFIYPLELAAKEVTEGKGGNLEGTPSQLMEAALELTPERLSAVLRKIAERGGVESDVDGMYPVLALAFRKSILDMKRSAAQTQEIIDSFFEKTSLPSRQLEAYVSLPDSVRAEFLEAVRVLTDVFLTFMPYDTHGMLPQEMMEAIFARFTGLENGQWTWGEILSRP